MSHPPYCRYFLDVNLFTNNEHDCTWLQQPEINTINGEKYLTALQLRHFRMHMHVAINIWFLNLYHNVGNGLGKNK